MTSYPVVEHRPNRASRWIRERRLRLALAVGIAEAILIVVDVIPWFVAVGFAVLVFALYVLVRRRVQNTTVRSIAWMAALSQTVPVVVPLLVALVTTLAIIALVVFALIILGLLFLDRR